MKKEKIVVYGLTTEGYFLASQMAMKGADVSIIDESSPSAVLLKAETAKTYPDLTAFQEDEPLLSVEPIDVAISNAKNKKNWSGSQNRNYFKVQRCNKSTEKRKLNNLLSSNWAGRKSREYSTINACHWIGCGQNNLIFLFPIK
jgi:hypothetical protein